MLRLISKALIALALLANSAVAQSFTLPELGLQNSGNCRQLAARDRTSNAMIALGCLDTVAKGWSLSPNVIQLQGTGSTGIVRGMSVMPSGGSIARSFASRATDNQIQAIDYGVKCDGTTDDGPAIMAATNYAVSLGGRDLVFPFGTCLLKTYLTPPSSTRWVSRSGTVVKFDPNMTTGSPIGGYSHAITFNGVSNILLDGITFQGAGAASVACPQPCYTVRSIHFYNANNVTIRNTTVTDMGSTSAYIPGMGLFGGTGILIDHSNFYNASGDNLIFASGTRNVEVRSSIFGSSKDSEIGCTDGGSNHSYHDNVFYSSAGISNPVLVIDRCNNVSISSNKIYFNGNGGQAVRVARYGDTTDTNFAISIANNTITGTAGTGISVENSATKQGSQTVTDGGRFAVTGNTISGIPTAISVSDSEVGSVTGNVISGASNTGILAIAYVPGVTTGSLILGNNTVMGSGAANSVGIRQLAAGGTLGTNVLGTNLISGFANPTLGF